MAALGKVGIELQKTIEYSFGCQVLCRHGPVVPMASTSWPIISIINSESLCLT